MYIVLLRDNIHSEVSLLGDKIHYTVYSSTFGEVYAITTYYMDGFALMFPSTTLNSPLSIIYLDPILGIMTFSESIFPSLSNHVHYDLKFKKSAFMGSLSTMWTVVASKLLR